jgi:hypothetical protein
MKIMEEGGSKLSEVIQWKNIVFFGLCVCVLYKHPSIEGGNKMSSKSKNWEFKKINSLRLGKNLENGP